MSADCPPTVTMLSNSVAPTPPYEAGDMLTCDHSIANDDPSLQVEWFGTNGGMEFSSTSSIVTLLEGEFCLICIVSVDFEYCPATGGDDDEECDNVAVSTCSGYGQVCDSALSKYRKQPALLSIEMLSYANTI